MDDLTTEKLEMLKKKLRGMGRRDIQRYGADSKRAHLHREKTLMPEKQKEVLKTANEQIMTEQEKKAFDALADASKQITDHAKELRDTVIPEDYPLPLTKDEQKHLREHLCKPLERYAHDNTIPDPSTGIKYDDGKTRFDLLIAEFVKEVADVFTKGLDKYPAWNYLKLHKDRIVAAHLRHFNAYQRGELTDSETGLSHLAHATCCLQMLWAIDNEFFGKAERLEQIK